MAKKKNLFPEIKNYTEESLIDNGHILLKSTISYDVPLPPELEEKEKSGIVQESLKIWTSPYMTVPYLIKSPDGTKVQVKFLNSLDKNH